MHVDEIIYFVHVCVTVFIQLYIIHSDQYQYLGNCPPTPPLTQQQSIDDKLGLMLG